MPSAGCRSVGVAVGGADHGDRNRSDVEDAVHGRTEQPRPDAAEPQAKDEVVTVTYDAEHSGDRPGFDQHRGTGSPQHCRAVSTARSRTNAASTHAMSRTPPNSQRARTSVHHDQWNVVDVGLIGGPASAPDPPPPIHRHRPPHARGPHDWPVRARQRSRTGCDAPGVAGCSRARTQRHPGDCSHQPQPDPRHPHRRGAVDRPRRTTARWRSPQPGRPPSPSPPSLGGRDRRRPLGLERGSSAQPERQGASQRRRPEAGHDPQRQPPQIGLVSGPHDRLD